MNIDQQKLMITIQTRVIAHSMCSLFERCI